MLHIGGKEVEISGMEATTESLDVMIGRRPTAITVERLAELLDCSPKTLYKAVKAGRLPAMRIGGVIRLDPKQTAAWIRQSSTVKAA
jgi:excisionase family DNA binding protein